MNQIIDLFPDLKELQHKGAEDVFYVVKVWVRISLSRKKMFFFVQSISSIKVKMDYLENETNTYHYFSL